jgi:hypothetical protein
MGVGEGGTPANAIVRLESQTRGHHSPARRQDCVRLDGVVKLLIATWRAGGATQVAIGLGRLLSQRGHRVRIFGPG